jgi:hypothetical protein
MDTKRYPNLHALNIVFFVNKNYHIQFSTRKKHKNYKSSNSKFDQHQKNAKIRVRYGRKISIKVRFGTVRH